MKTKRKGFTENVLVRLCNTHRVNFESGWLGEREQPGKLKNKRRRAFELVLEYASAGQAFLMWRVGGAVNVKMLSHPA